MNFKFNKILFSFVLIISLMLSLFVTNTLAARDTVISFNKNTLSVGENLTVNVTVNGSVISGTNLEITYNSELLEYVSGATYGGAGALKVVGSVSPPASKTTYSITFKTLKAGSATISVAGEISDGEFPNVVAVTLGGASASATVKDATASGNANLSALSGSAGTLSPKFNPNTTSYTVNVNNSVTSYTVYATAADKTATVKVPSTTNLKNGKNTISVTVTAANGSTKTYTLNVVRSETPVEEDPEVSEPETTEPIVDGNIATTTINNTEYIVLNDLTGVTLLSGFTASATEFDGKTVAIALDKKELYKVYYLKSVETNVIAPFTYDAETNTFSPVKYISKFGNDYIYCEMPSDKVAPSNYYSSSASIDNQNYKCLVYSDKAFKDFYYIYCYFDGETNFYRYDSKQGTMQRYPELKLSDKAVDVPEVSEEPSTMIERVKDLSTNAKIIFGAAIFAGLCVLTIFILLIVRTILRNKYAEVNGDFEDEFEELNFITSDDTEVKNVAPTDIDDK